MPALLTSIEQRQPNLVDSLAALCDFVSSSFGTDSMRFGDTVRHSNGLQILSSLLDDAHVEVRKQALFIIANLSSDAFDEKSALSKRLLLLQSNIILRLIYSTAQIPMLSHLV